MSEESQSVVEITLFGGIAALCRAGPVRFHRSHAALLLAFLATYPDTSHSRENLANRFWYTERDKQIRSLEVTYNVLCDALKPDGASLFFRGPGTIGLRSDAMQTDTARFEALLLDRRRSEGDREKALASALALYKGPFCGDHYDINDLDDQTMWIAQNRLRLALLRTQALAEMAQIQAARGDRRAAFAYVLKIPDPQILPEPDRAAVHALLLEANVPPEVLYFTLPETPDTHDEAEEREDTESRMQAVADFLSHIQGMESRAVVSERAAVRALLEAKRRQLPHDAQALLPQLWVFTGGCTAQSVGQVCRCGSSAEAERLLEMLTERHLLLREPQEEGGPRYRLQKTIAALLEERLSPQERSALLRRLTKWLLHKYRDFNRLDSPGQSKQLRQMLAEEDTTRSLLETFLSADRPAPLWRHAVALLLATRDCWAQGGRPPEHFAWFCRAQALPLRLSARSRLRLSVQQLNAAMLHRPGHGWVLENAPRIIQEAQQSGKQQLVGEALSALAISAHYRGEGALARQIFPLALHIFPQEPGLLSTYAEVLSVQGEAEEARRCYERALNSPDLTSGDEARVKCLYAGLRVFLGEYEEAEALLDAALHHSHCEENDALLERTYREIGQLYLARCRFGQAWAAFLQSQALCRKLEDPHSASDARRGQGLVALRRGKLALAREIFIEARRVWEDPAHSHWLAVFSLHLAETACHAGNLDEAEAHLREADRTLRDTLAITKKIEARYLWGLLHLQRGAVRQAVEAHQEALRSALRHGGRYQVLTAAEGVAMASIAAGASADGARLLGAAAAERAKRGIPLPPVAQQTLRAAVHAVPPAGTQDEYQAGTRLTLEQAWERHRGAVSPFPRHSEV